MFLVRNTHAFLADVVRFDNTYSWTRGKTVHYTIDVLEPDEGEHYETTDTADDIFTSSKNTTNNYKSISNTIHNHNDCIAVTHTDEEGREMTKL